MLLLPLDPYQLFLAVLQDRWEPVIAHPIHLRCLVLRPLQLGGLACAAHQKASPLTLSVSDVACNGQPCIWYSLSPVHRQGSQGTPVFGMMLRSDFLPVASNEKTSNPEVLLPWVLRCLLHPHPSRQLSLPLQKELCNAEVAHLHRVATEVVVWVSHPAPQKSCCRGVINIPVAHVPY